MARDPSQPAPGRGAATFGRDGLVGLAFPALVLTATAPPLLLSLVTVIPAGALLLALEDSIVGAARRGSYWWIAFLLPPYACGIAGWTILWAGSQYGSAWPSVLAFLVGIHAPSFVLQVVGLVRATLRAR